MSERLRVRRPTPADRAAYLDLLRSSEAFHRPWSPRPADTGADRLPGGPFGDEAFARYLASDDGERTVRFLLATPSEPEVLVGAINLNELVRGVFHSAYLGYWLGAAHTGCGYMREGLRLVLAHAFTPTSEGGLGLHRLEANIVPMNIASLAVVRSLGFRREGYSPRYLKIDGRWQDHERWALTLEDLDPPLPAPRPPSP